MNEFVIGKPGLLNKDLLMKRISDILDSSKWGNNGYYVQATEEYIKDYTQCQDCILVSNATVGLDLCIKYLKSQNPYLESCLIPSFTFVAAATVLQNNNIEPVFGDIDKNYCLDPKELEGIIDYDMVMPANLFGNICDDSFNGFPGVFDNAHATGIYNEKANCYVGADSDLSVFSQHSTKLAGSGEAGFITCSDKSVGQYLRELRNFGYKTTSGLREGEVDLIGTNAKVSEIQAAVCLTQLENLPEIMEHYFNIHQEYEKCLKDLNILKPKNTYFSNWSYVIVEVDNRDKVIDELNKDKIYPRSYFKPIHHFKAYKERVNLPNTELAAARIMALPTGLTISTEDVRYICSKLRRILDAGRS